MEDFLAFRKMLTPVFIKIVFWLGIVVTILLGLVMLVKGGPLAIVGLIYIFAGPIVVRIWCELIIVIFTINDTLTDIRKHLVEKSDVS
jgi:hypothetical protein